MTINVGTQVIVKAGYGYHLTDPLAFARSSGNVTGTVTAIAGGLVYFRLSNKRLCYAPPSSLEPYELVAQQVTR